MSTGAILKIPPRLVDKIREHGSQTYPHECCGALLGRDAEEDADSSPVREIHALFPLPNRRQDSPRNRFSLTAEDVRDAERAADLQGLQVVGWYHSHPDHPARPSDFDRQHAWPFYSYVIVSIAKGEPVDMTSWQLQETSETFAREDIESPSPRRAD